VRTVKFWILAAAFAAGAPTPAAIKPEDILNHLEQTIAWYRHLQGVEQASSDVLLRQNVHQASLKALQLAFDFARAEAALLSAEAQPGQSAPNPGSGNLQQASTRAADRVTNMEKRVSDLDAAISKAPARQRETLDAQRRTLIAELDLAKQIQTTIQTLVNFSGNLGSTGGAAAGLTGQIDELERSVPEARHDKRGVSAPAAAPANTATAPPVFQPESRGIVGLITDVFSLRSRQNQMINLRKETDALAANIDRLRAPLVNELRTSIGRADQIGNAAAPQNASDANAAEHELTGLSARFKQISTAMIPLAEENIAVGTTRAYLQDSIGDLDAAWGKAGRYLLLRAIMLAGAIFVILVISEVWRRATFRYVSDSRRRRQFLMIRRIVVTCAVIFTVVLGFVTEFGSLATYAGFVTAGIAVALQNPILSVVGYFFLIGRYGLRVGDRVTISGVTGEIIEIGLIRIYMMELGPEMRSTGRVVVFSNSVIFQPAALYKQMPGLDYVWHTVTLTLSSDSDSQLAETKLTAAVDDVYQQYKERIELQHRNLAHSIDVDLSTPRPETRMRFTDAGLEFTVRYPAELKQGAATDDRVTKALYDTIASEPKLKFAPAGRPKVQLAA
jgi:small-conductance mechanosensitive channel